jgi:hypothetical protein
MISILTILPPSFGASLRVHRRLRIHQAFRANPSFAWPRRSQNKATDKVHSVYLQPCCFGKRSGSCCSGLQSRQVRCLCQRPCHHEERECSAAKVSFLRKRVRERRLHFETISGVWMTWTTKCGIELLCIFGSSAKNHLQTHISEKVRTR